jgi:NitT/TauT family transport system ATP-binding protein
MVGLMLSVVRAAETQPAVPATAGPPTPRHGHVVIDRLSIRFGSGEQARPAVETLSLDVPPGEFVCILGPSGCGKSTVLNAIAGFVTPAAGTLTVDGEAVAKPGADRGMVFQQPTLFPWKTVIENIAFGPLMSGRAWADAESTARSFMGMVGLLGFEKHYPAQLSGGMQQRVGIARALANYPRVLLMDEPFGALDAQTRVMMQEALLGIWNEFHTTVVFVTHDIDEAVFLGDRVVVMSAGPGRILADIRVDLPRPREPDLAFTPEFTRIKRQCFDLIRTESLRAFEQQSPRHGTSPGRP